MANRMTEQQVMVWAGRFPTQERLNAYFDETSEAEDDQPISEFAAGQGNSFYDHDFLEVHFTEQPTTEIRPLLEGCSFSSSYVEAVARAFAERATLINTLVLYFAVFADELENAQSVTVPDFELHYLGTFPYDPRADSVISEQMAVVPASVLLELQSPGTVTYQGQPVRAVSIDARGLTIGRGGAANDQPYLDLEDLPQSEGVAPVQLRIYQDRFEQWVIEDEGDNGLTSIGGTALNRERSMPWHQDRVKVGPAVFLWNCFPGAANR